MCDGIRALKNLVLLIGPERVPSQADELSVAVSGQNFESVLHEAVLTWTNPRIDGAAEASQENMTRMSSEIHDRKMVITFL